MKKQQKLVPAVVFQQPDDVALVEGEATRRLDLWEQDLAQVLGGKKCQPGELTTRSQVGCSVKNDDCKTKSSSVSSTFLAG